MNLFNLFKRPSIVKVPETSQEMVNQMLINAIEELGIMEDNFHYLEERYAKLKRIVDYLGKTSEVSKSSAGRKSIFVSDFIHENNEIFHDALMALNLGAKYMELDAEIEEETE